jgi:hypothetical protein
MQFYILLEDAQDSAQLMPDKLLRVNVREGWQILSDIGHHFGVTFPGQTKPYNPNHPTTMRHRECGAAFAMFRRHYVACLEKYHNRFGVAHWHAVADNVPWITLQAHADRVTRYQTIRQYVLTAKRRQLTNQEASAL